MISETLFFVEIHNMQGSTYLLLSTMHGAEFTVGVNYSAATLLWLCSYQRYQLKAQLKAVFCITFLCSP